MTDLSFFGAAGTVTGSCTLIEAAHGNILVDCGMFQGNKTVRALNDGDFPFDPASVDVLLLTHAHIDHCGLMPKLVKHGFRGTIHCTEPTKDLLPLMLLDSAHIQESNTERRNRKLQRHGKPLLTPLYTKEDASQTLEMLAGHGYEAWVEVLPGVQARFWNAGHMLGSSSIEVKFEEPSSGNLMRLLFSGDIGPDEKVFHPEPDSEKGFDYIVCESTYGGRERDDYTLKERRAALKRELTEGIERGGNVIIPAFAVERSQELLHDIGVLLATGQIPKTSVYLDSPLATRVTKVFKKYAETLEDTEISADKLFADGQMTLIENVQDSKRLNERERGAVIISASGMADAGRIQHHLKHNIWRKDATVLFVGYQAPGTTGAHITSGAPDVMIHGRRFKVAATIRRLGNYSAHADQGELLDWIMERGPVAGGIFLNHGDDDAREELRRQLGERGLDVNKVFLPEMDELIDITADKPQSKGRTVQRIAPTELLTDWYNEYASLMLKLGNRLEDESDASKRKALLAQVRKAMD